jgi:hypothetical protein
MRSPQDVRHDGLELGQPGIHILAQVDAYGRQLVGPEGLEVP